MPPLSDQHTINIIKPSKKNYQREVDKKGESKRAQNREPNKVTLNRCGHTTAKTRLDQPVKRSATA
jgi:hypothetical protein